MAKAARPREYDLLCESLLPRGCEPDVPPPLELRVAIGGKMLDQIGFRIADGTHAAFPVGEHVAKIGDDGAVTVTTHAMTLVQLFTMGLMSPIGGPPVELVAVGRTFPSMCLISIHALAAVGNDRVVLRFERASDVHEPSDP